MNKLNVEIAHIYAHESVGKEQIQSIREYRNHASNIQISEFTTAILIDDYHSSGQIDLDKLIRDLKVEGITPDFLCFESNFVQAAEELLSKIPNHKLSWESFSRSEKRILFLSTNSRKIALKEKTKSGELTYTCAFLSAAWALFRLGLLNVPEDRYISITGKSIASQETLTVLPEKYEKNERKVLDILKAAGMESATSKMNYHFFKEEL